MSSPVRLPPIPKGLPANAEKYLRDVAAHVQMELGKRTRDETAKRSTLLLSPDGAAWEVTIDNAGALTSTKVQG